MKLRFVELLRCPACRGHLSLSVFSRSEEEVAAGPASPACRAFCTRYDRPVAEGFEPDCQACYRDDVAEGVLDCAQCQLVYPIIAGVPRLVRNALEEYAAFFERHQQAIGQSERIGALAARLGRVDPAIFDRRSNESFS